MIALLWCAIGLAALIGGAELLVRSGTRLAGLMGISPILIGLTVVAIGTSSPELAVGIDAALRGNGALAVGNIAGTNTFNILFIFGFSALLLPLSLERRSMTFDLPVMLAAALALMAVVWDGMLTRPDGVFLVCGAILYTGTLVTAPGAKAAGSRRNSPPNTRSSRRVIRVGISPGTLPALSSASSSR